MPENETQKNDAPAVNAKQRRAIQALLTSANTKDAAEAAGVKRQTIYRWMKDANFRQALKEAEAEALDALSRSLVALAEKAAKALSDALDDEDPRLRVRAADIVLSRLLQLRELADIEERLTRLERMIHET